mmetsp:Transcript_28723/g.75997  ORF Transcript_28723/g.75997 Transcript_28723/m.75997 type:complete len:202 (+) Transcript_28723:255-860(+)
MLGGEVALGSLGALRQLRRAAACAATDRARAHRFGGLQGLPLPALVPPGGVASQRGGKRRQVRHRAHAERGDRAAGRRADVAAGEGRRQDHGTGGDVGGGQHECRREASQREAAGRPVSRRRHLRPPGDEPGAPGALRGDPRGQWRGRAGRRVADAVRALQLVALGVRGKAQQAMGGDRPRRRRHRPSRAGGVAAGSCPAG